VQMNDELHNCHGGGRERLGRDEVGGTLMSRLVSTHSTAGSVGNISAAKNACIHHAADRRDDCENTAPEKAQFIGAF